MRYPVVIHKDPQSDYGVSVPDLPGCFSAGVTMDEALLEVVEAIECHAERLLSALSRALKNEDIHLMS